jgi:uncharacterized protein (DUF58 family)
VEKTSPSRRWRLWRGNRDQVEVTVYWRVWILAPLVLLLLLVELIAPARVWVGLLIVLMGTIVVAAWWAWQMVRQVTMKRELRYAWVQVGDLIEELFIVDNDALIPVLWLEITDHSNLPGYSASVVRAASARRRNRWTVQGTCRLRGEYQLGPWEARTGDPFGLFLITWSYPISTTLLVYPPIARWRPPSLPRGAAIGQAGSMARARQPTATVRAVREYSPGDPFHHIHWPTTARRGRLHVREFDQETGGDVWLLIDLDQGVQAGTEEHSTLEVGIILAASMAARWEEANRRVGLLTYGAHRQIVRPGQGREHLWRILRALALAEAMPDQPLTQTLAEAGRVLPTGSTLILLTPSPDPRWAAALARLKRRGVASKALLLAHDGTQHLTPLRSLLSQAGVESEIVNVLAPLQVEPPTGRASRWEFKVLPTGRAIAVNRPRRTTSP